MALVDYEKRKHLVIITLNRPEKLNALNTTMLDELRQAWVFYRDDDDAHLAILTGRGRAFTVGADASLFAGGSSPEALARFDAAMAEDPYWSGRLDKPTMVAANGLVIGGGLQLFFRADLRLAAESVEFRQAEADRGIVVFFHDILPPAIAAELVSGFTIPAARAAQIGMVNCVVPDGALMTTAFAMAEEFLSRPPEAVSRALSVIRRGRYSGQAMPRILVDDYAAQLTRSLATRRG